MLAVLGVLLGACGDDREVTTLAVCENSPALGTSCGGGIVFENNYQNQGAVLIVAGSDESAADYKTARTVTAQAQDANDGRNNTGTVNASHPASFACDGLESGGFDDWYLPAVNELLALDNNQSSVPGIAAVTYWSSTEGLTVTKGQEVDMFDSTASQTFKDTGFNIRCIRRITPSPFI